MTATANLWLFMPVILPNPSIMRNIGVKSLRYLLESVPVDDTLEDALHGAHQRDVRKLLAVEASAKGTAAP